MMTILPMFEESGTARTLWTPFCLQPPGKNTSQDGMKRTVNVKWIADDTIEIEENDYYIYLALLHASEDKVLSFEEPRNLPLVMI